jgi:serine/threonine-protein kinase RsbW
MEPTLLIPAEVQKLAELRRFVEEAASASQVKREAIEDMVQAVDEAATNIIVHGYQGQKGIIEAKVRVEEGALVVQLCDEAPLFDPTKVPPPDLTQPLEQRRFGGLGVHLARHFTDSIDYRVNPDGCNELTLKKLL